jgi:hypothetical protein
MEKMFLVTTSSGTLFHVSGVSHTKEDADAYAKILRKDFPYREISVNPILLVDGAKTQGCLWEVHCKKTMTKGFAAYTAHPVEHCTSYKEPRVQKVGNGVTLRIRAKTKTEAIKRAESVINKHMARRRAAK